MPSWIINAPSLHPPLHWVYNAFGELNTCRSIGMTAGPIPWTAIIAYADEEGLHGQDRADFVYLIRRMDTHVLVRAADQLTSARKTKTTSGKASKKIGGK